MKHKLDDMFDDNDMDEILIHANNEADFYIIRNEDTNKNVDMKSLNYIDIRRKSASIKKKEPRLFLYKQKVPDPKLCINYVSAMYDVISESESIHLKDQYTHDEKFMNARNTMIDNIIRLSSYPVNHGELLTNHSLWLAISILDRYLDVIYEDTRLLKKEIDISTICFKLAFALINPSMCLHCKEIETNELLSIEGDILMKLNYDLYATTVYDFLIYFYELIHASKIIRSLANYYAECIVYFNDVYQITKPSLLAASILYASLLQQNTFSDINLSIINNLGYYIKDESNIDGIDYSTPNNNVMKKFITSSGEEFKAHGIIEDIINNDYNIKIQDHSMNIEINSHHNNDIDNNQNNNHQHNSNQNNDNDDNYNITEEEARKIQQDMINFYNEFNNTNFNNEDYQNQIDNDNKDLKQKQSNIKLWELYIWLDFEDNINDFIINENISKSNILNNINIKDIMNISKLIISKIKENDNIQVILPEVTSITKYDESYNNKMNPYINIIQEVKSKYSSILFYHVADLKLPF